MGFTYQKGYAQDVWLQNFFSPTNGCELSNSELVNVLINNNSGSFIPANSITVSYSVNAGAPVSELLGVNLFSGASWNFTFGTNIDLSGCGAYNMKVWVSYLTDPNQLNDTLNWVVQNDCIIVPGFITSNATVCEGMNGAVMDLNGWTNGSIIDWQLSTDSGTSWTGIGNTTSSNTYNNIDTTTLYHVIFDGGFCPDDTSDIVTITVQPFPSGGTISSSATHCIDNASGTLTLSGAFGAVIFWQYSTDNGASWVTLANNTNSQDYLNLIEDTWYRTSTEGLICPNVFSDTAYISIDPLTVSGTLGADYVVCEGSTVSLELLGYTGSIIDWESSEDLVVWTSLGNTNSNYDTPPLAQTTYYRVNVQSGVCADMYSDTITITIDSQPIGGVINTSTTHCKANASGVINLVGSVGTINFWEYSEDGGVTWNNIANNGTSESYTALVTERWYRVQIEGESCPDVYSDTAIITIWEDSYAGILINDAVICEGESVNLQTVGSIGTSIIWESSEDLLSWNSFATGSLMQTVTPTITSNFRVIVKNEGCLEDTSNFVFVTVNPLPIVNAGSDTTITEFDTIQLNGSIGTSVLWSPAYNISDTTIFNPLAWPTSTTTYTYTVITIDGCQDFDEITITVNPFIVLSINIRNVVTPNGDGFNDFWMITGIEDFPDTEVHIINIYGQEVYQSMDYKNDWGGTYKGKKLPNGTYHFVVRLKDAEEVIKGNLTLLGNE